MRLIPRTMSTQHPDNANVPHWARSEVISGDDEVTEAFIAFSSLGVQEVMWDAEGKDVDSHVVRKLFTNYSDFFKEKKLGKDIFLTYRIPNPRVEGAERKVLAETLDSIPKSYDLAIEFYGKDGIVPPVFEVILPMTTNYQDLIAIVKFYENVIVGKDDVKLIDDLTARDLIGETNPKKIEIIPLIEDKDSMSRIDDIVGKYVEVMKPPYLRVFLARSDPAMNYSMFAAVLSVKYALSRLAKLSEKFNIPFYPIIGVGSLPFRGHNRPGRVEKVLDEYRGVYTVTVQSAFRYDFDEANVKEAIRKYNTAPLTDPEVFSEEEENVLVDLASRFTANYQPKIEGLADLINKIATLLPRRRARKLHIGLFGYSRSTGKVTLPRAISFVGALYTLGIPPELIGVSTLGQLNEKEYEIFKSAYKYFEEDIREAARFFNYEALDLLSDLWKVDQNVVDGLKADVEFVEDNLGIKLGGNDYDSLKHTMFSTLVHLALKDNKIQEVRALILEMAKIRKSIG